MVGTLYSVADFPIACQLKLGNKLIAKLAFVTSTSDLLPFENALLTTGMVLLVQAHIDLATLLGTALDLLADSPGRS